MAGLSICVYSLLIFISFALWLQDMNDSAEPALAFVYGFIPGMIVAILFLISGICILIGRILGAAIITFFCFLVMQYTSIVFYDSVDNLGYFSVIYIPPAVFLTYVIIAFHKSKKRLLDFIQAHRVSCGPNSISNRPKVSMTLILAILTLLSHPTFMLLIIPGESAFTFCFFSLILYVLIATFAFRQILIEPKSKQKMVGVVIFIVSLFIWCGIFTLIRLNG